MASVPGFAWLCFHCRIAEEQGRQRFFVPGKRRPEVAHAAESGREEAGETYESQACRKAPNPSCGGGDEQEDPVNPEGIRQLQTGDGQSGEKGNRAIE